jgi:hypothetical protein
MHMDAVALQAQRELDRDILAYCREMQKFAPVTEESIVEFERSVRRRDVLASRIRDRLAYLVSRGDLERKLEWQGGEFVHFVVTAQGMDVLDGNLPPPNWKPGGAA